MTRFTYIVFVSALITTSLATLPALALSSGDISITTKSELAIPGHLLEPGTYSFRRAVSDDPAIYKIVRDDGRLVGFIQVIPTIRASRTDTEVDVTAPDAAGVRLLESWYGPGDNNGYELIYAKGDIQKLDHIAELRSHSSGYAAGQH